MTTETISIHHRFEKRVLHESRLHKVCAAVEEAVAANKDLGGAYLQGVNLSNALLMRGRFLNADFRDATLVNVDFTNADLRGSIFTGTQTTGMIVDGANLDGAIGLKRHGAAKETAI